MSLRLKIALILIVSSLIGDALFIVFWQPWHVNSVMQRERAALRGHLLTLSDAVTPFLLQNQIAAVHEVFDATLERQPEWRSLSLQDGDGLQLYPLDAPAPLSGPHLEHLHHDLALRNSTLGHIEMVADLSPLLAEAKRTTWVIAALLTAGFLLTATLIAMILDVVVARRTQRLAAAAERMGQGDFEQALEDDQSDEIGRLAQALDAMRQAIAAQEKSLLEARLAAEASNRAKSTFLATMSHEIRTPMNGILGMAQLLMSPQLSDAERLDFAGTITSSGQTLLTLLNDILDLSKVEAGKIELVPTVFDPARLLDETRNLFVEMAEQHGLTLIADPWPGPAGRQYHGDANRLRQMLANLTSNAIKFTPAGRIELRARELDHALNSGVKSGAERVENSVLIEFSVSDTGIGIAPEKLAQLFQPFTQIDGSNTRKYAGTGLGLSIVRSLSAIMGGEAGVDSEQGKGSTFWFRVRLPIASPAPENAPSVGETTRVSGTTNPPDDVAQALAGTRILVVDDNAINRKVIEALLVRHGIAVASVADGQQALAALRNEPAFSLVLMDCQMPVMDGFEATRAWRAHETANPLPNLSHLPIIALTAGAFETDRQACLAAGMDDFIAKPVNVDQLLATLQRWLPAKAAAQ